jgi:hypothetical protein
MCNITSIISSFRLFSSSETLGEAQDAEWLRKLTAGESFELLIITDISSTPDRGDLYDVQQNAHNYLFWPLASNRNVSERRSISSHLQVGDVHVGEDMQLHEKNEHLERSNS